MAKSVKKYSILESLTSFSKFLLLPSISSKLSICLYITKLQMRFLDDDDGVFLFQEKHETQELYLVTSPRHAWG